MEPPIYPTVHMRTYEGPESFQTNTIRVSLETCIPMELVEHVDATNVVVEELLGKARGLISRPEQKEITDGRH